MRTIPANKSGIINVRDTFIRGKYYGSGYWDSIAMNAGYLTANRLYAVPFVWGGMVATKMDLFGFHLVTGVTGKKARCGIYNSLLDQPYPGALYLASSEFDVGGSITHCVDTVDFFLKGGRVYFAVLISDGAIRVYHSTPDPMIMGHYQYGGEDYGDSYDNAILIKDTTYGALPDPFPADAVPYYGYSSDYIAPLIEWRVA